jgi:hypothetical protein
MTDESALGLSDMRLTSASIPPFGDLNSNCAAQILLGSEVDTF